MPEYRRVRIEGGTYFFTVVTYHRHHILTDMPARKILHNAWMDTEHRFPFETIAVCQLPDHLHCIWKLPQGDANYSIRWKEIKRLFTRRYLKEIENNGEERNSSRIKREEATVWQRRFWEHTIMDEEDLDNHLDYIHYNPVKHGYTTRAADWPWTTFHRYVKAGYYKKDWQGDDQSRLQMLSFE